MQRRRMMRQCVILSTKFILLEYPAMWVALNLARQPANQHERLLQQHRELVGPRDYPHITQPNSTLSSCKYIQIINSCFLYEKKKKTPICNYYILFFCWNIRAVYNPPSPTIFRSFSLSFLLNAFVIDIIIVVCKENWTLLTHEKKKIAKIWALQKINNKLLNFFKIYSFLFPINLMYRKKKK